MTPVVGLGLWTYYMYLYYPTGTVQEILYQIVRLVLSSSQRWTVHVHEKWCLLAVIHIANTCIHVIEYSFITILLNNSNNSFLSSLSSSLSLTQHIIIPS